ncbi:MAG: DMT family transporter, partial [Candidatus Zixiibacteriota bacterium]
MILVRMLLLVTITFWGWSFVATKICLNYMTPLEVIGWRYLLGLPVLLVIILLKRLRPRFSGKEMVTIILSSIVVTTHFLIQVTGMKYTTATNTGWLIAVTPLALAVLAFIFLKERTTRNAIIGIVIATVGITLLVSRGDIAR